MSLSFLSREIFDHYRYSTPLLYFDTIDSTNDEAMRQLEATAHDRVTVVAAAQTRGRGRRGNTWVSDNNGNIYASIGLKFKEKPQNLGILAIKFALILCEAIEYVTGISLKIKWPNDLWYEDKKVAGILIESKWANMPHIVIGFGLNVHTAVQIENNATTALASVKPLELSTNALCTNLLQYILDVNLFDTSQMLKQWAPRDALFGRQVTVYTECATLYGIADGIQADGTLRLHTHQGLIFIPSGSVRLANLY